jgi:hypothetical protein
MSEDRNRIELEVTRNRVTAAIIGTRAICAVVVVALITLATKALGLW